MPQTFGGIMASALIVYGSTTGNTEYVASAAEKVLAGAGYTVKSMDVSMVAPSGLCDGYDLILFGCSTWGEDTIELQDDFIPLFDDFDKIGAPGKKTAVFGTGDTSYTYYCGAVDAIAEKLQELGATVLDTLKIDGDPQSEQDEIERWINSVISRAS